MAQNFTRGPDSIWIGFDAREAAAFSVTRHSLRRHLTQPIPVYGVILDYLRDEGLYTRPTTIVNGRLFDVISDYPMATEFAISRFLVPYLHTSLLGSGWALFLDSDMLVRGNVVELFRQVDNQYAVMCVKHDMHVVAPDKMDGQVQSAYARKNWSSAVLFNCNHPSNRLLGPALVNSARGIALHNFCWLKDHEIGEIGVEWNWLVGHSPAIVNPKIVHFTEGGPWFPQYGNVPFAQEWRDELTDWARV